MKLSNKKGFTLIELIIVIAILGIIALIAIPNLAGIRQRSQVSADKRTAEQIGKAVRIWLTDVDASATRVIHAATGDSGKAKVYDEAWTPTITNGKVSFGAEDSTASTLKGLCDTYISKGYLAKSLTGGAGQFYVTSLAGTGENNANEKIYIFIAENGASITRPTAALEAKYDGTIATYSDAKAEQSLAYVEK